MCALCMRALGGPQRERERESARERERDTVLLNIFRVENKIRELAN